MSARDIVGGLAGAAVGAVKRPVDTANEAISKARTAVGAGTAVGTAVAGTVVRRVRGDAAEAKDRAKGQAQAGTTETVDKASRTADEVAEKASGAAKEAAVSTAAAAKTATDAAKVTATTATRGAKKAAKKAAKRADSKAPGETAAKKSPSKKTQKKSTAKREPQVVMAEPALPTEPPIDVVGQALAAEQEPQVGAGRSTEPRGASRDEEHGEAALQRAEADEIAEEMAEAARAGNLDLSTPVGTTGADTGFNPDTAEAGLQQPGTEPLLDPSLTKEVKSEQDTLHQASDPEKG